MTYTLVRKMLAATTLVAVLVLGFALSVSVASAHQAATFDPTEPNCMGKLTSFHAKDDKGIKNSAATWPHVGIGGPHDGSVKSFQKLSKTWCDSDEDSGDPGEPPGDPGDPV